MASTGPAVVTSSVAVTSTSTVTGQGLYPIARCRLSFSEVSVATPVWTEVSNSDFRSFSISRGRESELSEFDAGSATIVLDNRDRAYDPVSLPDVIRPLNRVWLYEEFSGEVHDLFKGYVTSWDLEWPDWGGSDAIATANCSDEFLVLSQAALPTTDPPRDSYATMIAFDQPVGYWDLGDDPAARQQGPTETAPWEPSAPEDPTWLAKDGRRRVDLRVAPKRPRKG